MIDCYMFTSPGGRDNNEDFITKAEYGEDKCFILCDGLGGHDCGEVASSYVAGVVAEEFTLYGDSADFLKNAFNKAQQGLLALQEERGMTNAMKTTLVVLIVTGEHIKWAHIGDSRLYRFYESGTKYERTRDHSMVQILKDMGDITEADMRHHEDRNKLLRVMGAEWSAKSFDLSAVLERGETQSFALMTDGFWEYVLEDEMMGLLKTTDSAEGWLRAMEQLVLERADMTSTDNYSAICVKID
ncbi:MAG: serine/threonine-protein phosphatase [Lachnospiraceae bacterium]|nr:serine/threonine-protein phosphatase [Lachnospiraceae bacterium]